MSNKYLISIAIGPVQDFIASARRSRDLWFGSWLLSEISTVTAKKIGKENLIFPSNLSGSVVNKILAIIEKPDNNFDETLRKAIEQRLQEIYEGIFSEVQRKLGGDKNVFYREIAEAQIKDMYELYWAAIPYDEDVDDYRNCREKVETLLNARKTTREFKPVTWGGNVPKSSLDGQRESVILDKKIEDPKIQRIFNLRMGERLCGIGVLKRLAEKEAGQNFASTSHMASLPLLETLENNPQNVEAVEKYIAKLTNLIFEVEDKDLGKIPEYLNHPVFKHYDGHLLFENRLSDLPFENKEKEDEAKDALKVFMGEVFGNENKNPLPYYALLQADGDRMGKVIDNQNNSDEHKELSVALSKFANNVEEIVKNNQGCLIYAGGDDVLALLPLHTVLDCAKELSINFSKELSVNSKFVDKDEISPTLSAGIAVYHHTQPLQDALTTMRNAEKQAKSVDGKDALAITLSKRSGTDTTIRGKWKNDRNTDKSFDERIKWFVQLHLDDALPDGVAYELRDLQLRFQDFQTKQVSESFEEMLKAETIRILERKKSEGGTKEIDKEIFKELEKLVEKVSFVNRGERQPEWTLLDLANEIIVARDFARAFKQANIMEV